MRRTWGSTSNQPHKQQAEERIYEQEEHTQSATAAECVWIKQRQPGK